MGEIFGYARVSTQDQNLDLQIDALEKAGAVVIYKEKITGTKKERPGRLHEDSLSKAQATLVNFQHHLSLSKHWGDGSTSSSDGMRVQVGVSSLHADANPHYGTGKGTTIYRFTSDQFSSFYTKVINTNARDAVHVIDGLLHHESELSIEEHYTDTAGYTDQVFGLSHILGFRFAPRMRDLSDSKLYIIDKSNDYSKIESILRGKINIKVIQDNYDDVLRLAHSIREGKVSASLILGKLGSYSWQNKMATALREIGRIEKTIFILDYISNETLRRRVQRGLNKGEAMNGLRHVNSTILDVKHNESLLMFYFTLVFHEAIFYVEELETIVLVKEEEDTLHIFDIISLNEPKVEAVLASIMKETTKKVVFYFTPDFTIEGITATIMPNDDDALFVLTKKSLLKGNFMFPLTSHC